MRKIYFIFAVLIVATACFACKGEAIGVDETPPAVHSNSITSNFNHDWIVDGLMQINTRIRQNVVTHVMRYDYIYCNWGWKGQANGWYTYRMLDTFRGPLKGEIGETSSTHKYNFYDKIEILRNIKRYY